MLAYLFWHRPRPGVEQEEYEEAQHRFHSLLEIESACFRLERLPFAEAPGYEDWYLVEDWQALGELNVAAVDARRRGGHDRAAALAADGWGGIYRAVRGPAEIPGVAEWLHKPRGEATADFLGGLPEGAGAWQRQMVLGPAPEFCVARPGPPEDRRALLGTAPPRP
ncbi:MAG TPA: hypothetical protein VN732_08045 [Solirubrobacterales bacterium]|nr:hypothetical protein [Solirubrobacterales bacterium]